MCTLSIISKEQEMIVTMNRDEQRSRFEAQQLSTTDEGCFPVDCASSGTWIGLNAHGTIFALLNRYQDVHKSDMTSSRGRIIPTLLPCSNLNAVADQLRALNMERFAPFDCFAVMHQQLMHLAWTGEDLNISTQPLSTSFFVTSSSYKIAEVSKYRHRLFLAFLDKHKKHDDIQAKQILEELHLAREPGQEALAILMERSQVHTKSGTQIVVTATQAHMCYWPNTLLNLMQNTLDTHRIEQTLLF